MGDIRNCTDHAILLCIKQIASFKAVFACKKQAQKCSLRRARFSLLNKHPAGCPFTANLGGDFAPHTLRAAPAALDGSPCSQHGFAMKGNRRRDSPLPVKPKPSAMQDGSAYQLAWKRPLQSGVWANRVPCSS